MIKSTRQPCSITPRRGTAASPGLKWRTIGMAVIAGALIASDAVIALPPDTPARTLTWRGCGISKKSFMIAAAKAYAEATGVEFKLSGGGAALGIEAAGTGGADLGGTCRHCIATDKGVCDDIELVLVGWDALVAVVHPDNPIESLTSEQMSGILRQTVTNWNEVGGDDARIIPVVRKGKSSGVGYCVRLLILGDEDADFGTTAVQLNSSGPVEKLVERQRDAIAVTGVSSAKKRELRVLSIGGVTPTPENIAAGEYPYYRPLYVAVRPGENPDADAFIEWLLSDEGQSLIESQGTVSARQGVGLLATYQHFPKSAEAVDQQMMTDAAPQD